MLKSGFQDVEARDKNGEIRKYTKTFSNSAESSRATRIGSEYCVTHSFVRGLPWRVMRNELSVVRENNKRLIARHSDFIWFGMWWQEAASPVLGRGGECRHDAEGTITNALLHGVK